MRTGIVVTAGIYLSLLTATTLLLAQSIHNRLRGYVYTRATLELQANLIWRLLPEKSRYGHLNIY